MRLQTQTQTLWSGSYRVLLAIVIAMQAAALVHIPTASADKIARSMVVYKSPTCVCCGDWVEHIELAGISAKIQHPSDLNTIKDQLGVSPVYQACHTGALEGYVFEGHVPADVIQQFLVDKPKNAIGLAVPGMPLGSPGMETDSQFRPYQVRQLNKDGSSTPYAKVSASKTVYLGKKL
jgi:hypothetical protein